MRRGRLASSFVLSPASYGEHKWQSEPLIPMIEVASTGEVYVGVGKIDKRRLRLLPTLPAVLLLLAAIGFLVYYLIQR